MAKQEMGKQTGGPNKKMPVFLMKRVTEGGFILVLTCALFVLLALGTYNLNDPGWSHVSRKAAEIHNAGGQVGAYIADALYLVFGYFSYFIPLCAAYVAWMVVQDQRTAQSVNKHASFLRASGLFFVMMGGCGLLSLEPGIVAVDGSQSAGGLFGDLIATRFNYALNIQGASLLLLAIALVGVTWLTGLSWLQVTESIGFYTLFALQWCARIGKKSIQSAFQLFRKFQEREPKPAVAKTERKLFSPRIKEKKEKPVPALVPAVFTTPSITPASLVIESAPVARPVKEQRPAKIAVSGSLPSLSLLDKGLPGKALGGFTHQELENLSRDVEQHLLDFGIHADVVAVHPGPVITRFELQLAAGIKVSKLSALSKDLARALSVTSVRVVEVIPGKTVVGLELPNQHRDIVRLSEILSADVYQQAHSPLTIALGVDIAGHAMVVDLAKMPHLLVAGTTGSGKSVGINAMILSLLFKATPEQVRLIMIDPKMLELSVYDGIPHLLTPVVTDMKEAASALRWCVAEMERRYRLMSALGVRNLAGYNVKVTEAVAKGEPISDPLWKPIDSMDTTAPELESLPYVVVIIDELADMMMVVGKKVEQLIARIAQKARAAGIHLVLATQRPSVDVLTGLIKSNIPTRMSFQVSSKIDSRTILDQQGAEQLLGHGDMLYLAPGTGAPLRVHGAFVDDKEVHRIADDWRARGEPQYIDEITQIFDPAEGGGGEDGQQTEEADPLYDQAVEFVIQTRKASISAVQRRLKVGYNRAARLVEEMERTGIVGPLDGGYRDVLVTSANEE